MFLFRCFVSLSNSRCCIWKSCTKPRKLKRELPMNKPNLRRILRRQNLRKVKGDKKKIVGTTIALETEAGLAPAAENRRRNREIIVIHHPLQQHNVLEKRKNVITDSILHRHRENFRHGIVVEVGKDDITEVRVGIE